MNRPRFSPAKPLTGGMNLEASDLFHDVPSFPVPGPSFRVDPEPRRPAGGGSKAAP